MSYDGVKWGIVWGSITGVLKGDTWSLDYGSCGFSYFRLKVVLVYD